MRQDNELFRVEFGHNMLSVTDLFEVEAEIAPKGTLARLRERKKRELA